MQTGFRGGCHRSTELCSRGENSVKEEAKLSLPGHSCSCSLGHVGCFHREGYGKLLRLRLWLSPQIMTIPALIRLLWLMFDEEGDRLSGCFQHAVTPVSCAIPSSKQKQFFFPLQVVFHVSSSGSCFHPGERKQS